MAEKLYPGAKLEVRLPFLEPSLIVLRKFNRKNFKRVRLAIRKFSYLGLFLESHLVQYETNLQVSNTLAWAKPQSP